MAQPEENLQKQIENCQKQIDHLNEIINDPNSTQEQKDEATASLADQQKKMERLLQDQQAQP